MHAEATARSTGPVSRPNRRRISRRVAVLGFACAIVLACATSVPTAGAAAPAHALPADVTLPAGFEQDLVATGFYGTTLMTWAPDGRLFFSVQSGKIRIVENGVLVPKAFLSLSNASKNVTEVGMLGIAFDPAFATNHFVYVYYTNSVPVQHNQVSRFVARGDVAVKASETVIWSGAPTHDNYHAGGEIGFGADGKLYIAQGDSDVGAAAQSMQSTFGKILRINSDGTIPTDNPFYNTTTGAAQAIWALGLRNPYTWAFRPTDGLMLIDDVGANTWEEIDQGQAGANYGWPATEGPTSDPQFVSPVYAYQHVETPTGECAIIGGGFYDPANFTFPQQYWDKYFFMDHCAGWIKTFDPATGTVSDFMSGGVKPTSLTVGPDGAVYYLSHPAGFASLYKIVADNVPPAHAH